MLALIFSCGFGRAPALNIMNLRGGATMIVISPTSARAIASTYQASSTQAGVAR